MPTKFDLFEDMAVAIESWATAASSAMTNAEANLQWTEMEAGYKAIQATFANAGVDPSVVKAVVSECLRGLAVSFLTTLDGGTALAEKGRVYLVDERGERLGEGLHDDFASFLIESGRLV